jgi:hypothetical protein
MVFSEVEEIPREQEEGRILVMFRGNGACLLAPSLS